MTATPTTTIARLAGTDDHIVTVTHDDGLYVTFRVSADPTVGQFTTWDVSSMYADWGHDSHEDRRRAQRYFARKDELPARRQCPDCGVFTSNADHTCVRYSDEHPCVECGGPTVFVTAAAPGYGSGWVCRDHNHMEEQTPWGELSLEDVR